MKVQMNSSRPQSSPLFNVNDPIQVHLLVETALGDSKEYEILSQEEVDDLKKQCQMLSQRIGQTRQNLTIQSKYRDAAISMAKLYSASDKRKNSDDGDSRKPRRSLLGHRKDSSASEADLERLTSERKCEELAAELWSLEKRLMEPQSRLLKHTAGILQMTHKGPKKGTKNSSISQQNGIPGSPESIFTYSNARSSMEPVMEENFFDERSLYMSMDRLDSFGDFGGSSGGAGEGFRPPPKSQAREHLQLIAKTELKLEDLSSRLREVIVTANPARGASYSNPPLSRTNSQRRPSDPGETLQSHLDYLEKGIDMINKEQGQASKREEALEETIEEVNMELHSMLLPYDSSRPSPPQLDGRGLTQQLRYFQDSIGAVEMELSKAASNNNNKNDGSQEAAEQMKTIMMGLWEIIQSGEEEARQRKLERGQTRTTQGLPPDEDDSVLEDSDPIEPFALQTFSAKVQALYTQATRLKDQKKVLQRQIKQQRDLNSKSDATKDAEILQKVDELGRTKALLTRTEKDADNVREQLSLVMEKLDEARQDDQLRSQARATDESAAIRAAQEELEERNKTIADLEEELQDLKDDHGIANAEMRSKIAESESRISSLTQQISAIQGEKAESDAEAKDREATITENENEIEALNMKLAELQTEVTIARAELDGAYGTRAQRAAEAANPAVQREIENLTQKNAALVAELASLRQNGGDGEKMKLLKKELEETIEEYEQMTKASVEWEKEREELEQAIDKLRDERADLEAQLSDERVRWLGMKSPGVLADGTPGGLGAGQTSTTVLKNEFKKMMRDTRAESLRALRVCFPLPFLISASLGIGLGF